MKLSIHVLLITVILASCSSPSEKKAKEPKVNQDSINAAQYESELLSKEMELLKDSIENSKLDEQSLKERYFSERKKRIQLDKNLTAEKAIVDSLTNVNNNKDKRIAILSKNEQQRLAKDKEIESLISNLHTAINQLRSGKEEGTVLQYFLPQFSIKHVKIDTDNLGHIAEYTHEDYKKHLKDLTKEKNTRYEIENIKILDIERKEDNFFNALYRLKINSYEKEERQYTINTMVSLTGKRINGELKIASFSLVEFQYN